MFNQHKILRGEMTLLIVIGIIVSLFLTLTTTAIATQKVVVMAMTSPETNGLKAMADVFTKKTGIKVEFSEQGRLGYFTNVITKLVAGTTSFDLAQINTTYVTELAAAGAVDFWDEYLYNPKMTDLKQYDLNDVPIIYRYKGKIVTIPTDAMSQLLYYRTDLINKPPETWDELLEEAKKWTRSLNPLSPTAYGDVVSALAGPEPPKLFYPVLWSFGGRVFDDKGNVTLLSPESIKAAKFYRALKIVMPPDVTSYNYPKIFDSLKNGTVAMAGCFWNAAYNDIKMSDSEYKDKIGIALIPGVRQPDGSILRVPQTHSWCLVMNAKSKHKEAAWKFLLFATSKEGGRIHGRHGGSPYRTSILSDPTYAKGIYYQLMVKTLSMAKAEPLVPYYSQMHEIMNHVIAGILASDKPVEEILKKGEEDLKELVGKYR